MFDCAEFCSADAVGMIGNGVGDGVGDGFKVQFLRAEVMGKLRASNLESLKAWGVHIALLEGLAPLNHKKKQYVEVQGPHSPRALLFHMPSSDTKPMHRSRNSGKPKVQINDLYLAFHENQGTDQGTQGNSKYRSAATW